MTQTVPLWPAQTSVLLNHPPRSSSKSICAAQFEVHSVWEWGLRVLPRGSVCNPPPPTTPPCSHAGQISEPALMGFQPHCYAAHYKLKRDEVTVPAAEGRSQRNLMGRFVSWQFSNTLTSWVMCEFQSWAATALSASLIISKPTSDMMAYWLVASAISFWVTFSALHTWRYAASFFNF